MKPKISCSAKPVNLGERSIMKITRRVVSKKTTNLLRGDAIIPGLLIFTQFTDFLSPRVICRRLAEEVTPWIIPVVR